MNVNNNVNNYKTKYITNFSNNNNKINFFALGGQDERGKNCYVLEIDNNIFIFNAGALVPTSSLLGVKQLIPDFDWLVKNKKRIKGLFVGAPTQENLASLEYLIKAVGSIPIYVSIIGKTMIETLVEKKIQSIPLKSLNINVIENLKSFNIENQKIIPFKVCSAAPWSMGFAFHTPFGYVIYIDDFIFSNDKNFAFESSINDLSILVNGKVLLLVVGSGYVGKNNGFTSPNYKSKNILDQIVTDAKGRVFISCYDSNAYTILTVAQLAKQKGLPFIIYSHTFINIFSTIIKNKIFNNKNLITLPISEIDKTNNAIICITSNPHRLYARLSKIANNVDEKIHLTNKDTFVLITPRVAGYEGVEARILDDIAKNDTDYFKLTNDVLPMQASDEDHKYLLNLLKPKYIIPISGFYKDFISYVTVAKHVGISVDQIKILYNGEVLSLQNGRVKNNIKEIKLDAKYVDSSGVQDVDDNILFEREQMAENGVIIIALFYDSKRRRFLSDVKYELYGIVDEEDKMQSLDIKINENIKVLFDNLINSKQEQKEKKILMSEMREFKRSIKKVITKLFEKKFNKKPIVLSTVVDL